MRKFKLIKTYPGMDELGIKVTKYNPSDCYWIDNQVREFGWSINKHLIEDQPEFWEEIVEEKNKNSLYSLCEIEKAYSECAPLDSRLYNNFIEALKEIR